MSIIILIAYIVITICIGFYLNSRNKGTKDFFVAAGGLAIPQIMALLFAELIAGAGTVGVAADAYRYGVRAVWVNWGMSLGCFIFIFTIAGLMKAISVRRNVMSVAEVYHHLFDSRSRLVMTLIVTAAYSIMFSTQPVAAAAIISPLLGGVDPALCAWGVTIVFLVLTLSGGLHGLANMNVLHSFVMYVGLGIIAVLAIKAAGGIGHITATLPPEYFDLGQPSPWQAFSWSFGSAISVVAAATVANATFAAKSIKHATFGIFLAAVLVVIFAVFPCFIGIAARIVLPDIPVNNALFLMANRIGPVFGGIASMAIIAAIFSSAPAHLLLISATVTKDFYIPFINKEATEKQQMRFTRIVIVVVGIAATFFGLRSSSILTQIMSALQIRSIAGAVLIVAVYWRKTNNTGVFWSLIVGGALSPLWNYMGNPFGIPSLYPSLILGLIVLFVISLAVKQKEEPAHDKAKRIVAEYKAEFAAQKR